MNINFQFDNSQDPFSVEETVSSSKIENGLESSQNIDNDLDVPFKDEPYEAEIRLIGSLEIEKSKEENEFDPGNNSENEIIENRSDYYYAFPENLSNENQEDLENEEDLRSLTVKLIDLSDLNNVNKQHLEAAHKAIELGKGFLVPKTRENESVQVQANMADMLKKHKITQVKAIMPDGEVRIYNKFQTITHSNAAFLQIAFKNIANLILRARQREAEQERV